VRVRAGAAAVGLPRRAPAPAPAALPRRPAAPRVTAAAGHRPRRRAHQLPQAATEVDAAHGVQQEVNGEVGVVQGHGDLLPEPEVRRRQRRSPQLRVLVAAREEGVGDGRVQPHAVAGTHLFFIYFIIYLGSCHKSQKPQAPIRNR